LLHHGHHGHHLSVVAPCAIGLTLVSDCSWSRMRRDGGDAPAPTVNYRICRKNFLLAPGTFRHGTMLVNFTDQGLNGVKDVPNGKTNCARQSVRFFLGADYANVTVPQWELGESTAATGRGRLSIKRRLVAESGSARRNRPCPVSPCAKIRRATTAGRHRSRGG